MDPFTLRQQIGIGVLMSCGARDWVLDGDAVMFRVGPGRKLRKLIITLDPMDTYTVRFVEMNRKTYEIVADETVEGVGDHNIGAVVRRMGDRP